MSRHDHRTPTLFSLVMPFTRNVPTLIYHVRGALLSLSTRFPNRSAFTKRPTFREEPMLLCISYNRMVMNAVWMRRTAAAAFSGATTLAKTLARDDASPPNARGERSGDVDAGVGLIMRLLFACHVILGWRNRTLFFPEGLGTQKQEEAVTSFLDPRIFG